MTNISKFLLRIFSCAKVEEMKDPIFYLLYPEYPSIALDIIDEFKAAEFILVGGSLAINDIKSICPQCRVLSISDITKQKKVRENCPKFVVFMANLDNYKDIQAALRCLPYPAAVMGFFQGVGMWKRAFTAAPLSSLRISRYNFDDKDYIFVSGILN
jgi:hypothetical protein